MIQLPKMTLQWQIDGGKKEKSSGEYKNVIWAWQTRDMPAAKRHKSVIASLLRHFHPFIKEGGP
jgi:hypothetical protein